MEPTHAAIPSFQVPSMYRIKKKKKKIFWFFFNKEKKKRRLYFYEALFFESGI